jgi:hypothetical protein
VLVKRLRPRLVGLAIALLAGASYGNDEIGSSMVRGIGPSSCGKYVEAIEHSGASVKAENDKFAFLSWVGGYLSRYNLQGLVCTTYWVLQICQRYNYGFIIIVTKKSSVSF